MPNDGDKVEDLYIVESGWIGSQYTEVWSDGSLVTRSEEWAWNNDVEPKLAAYLSKTSTPSVSEFAYSNYNIYTKAGYEELVRLIAKYRPELTGNLEIPQEYLQNLTPAEAPSPVPANVIDGSPAQGTGSLPPAAAVGTTHAGTGSGEAASDSGGQGTASSPAAGRTGGDPIVLWSGQLYHQVTDLEVRGRGLHFAFMRTYLSRVRYKGPLGYTWDHSYNLWLREEREPQPDGTLRNVVYRSTGQAREDRYEQIVDEPVGDLQPLDLFADAVFTAPAGFFDRLEKVSGRYVFETVTGVRFDYNSDLYIERIADANGNEMTFEYGDGLLTRIRDPVGREFVLDYDEMNRIAVLTDSTGGRKLLYHYGSNGDLEEVDFAAADFSAGTDYRYAGPDFPPDLQHNLAEIVSPSGHSVLVSEYGTEPGTWSYNRVVRQRSQDGEYRYEYDAVHEAAVDPAADPVNAPFTLTRVFHPNDHCVEHWFNRQGNIVRRIEQIIGLSGLVETLVAHYRYNEDGLLVGEVRADGATREYLYERDAFAEPHGGDTASATPHERLRFGNLLRVVEDPRTGSGETRRIVTDYAYHAAGNRLASQTGPYYADPLLQPLPDQVIGSVAYEYDAAGNLTRITFPEVAQADGTPQIPSPAEFEYDAHGLVRHARVGPLHTEYVYFADLVRSGVVKEMIQDADGIARVTRYQADALGRITGVVEPYGAATDIEWTSFDAPRQITRPEVTSGGPRATVTYRYNRDRLVVESREQIFLPDGTPHPQEALVRGFRYDDFGRMVEQRSGPAADPSARRRRIRFNASGQVEKDIDFRGTVTRYVYDERMLLARVIRGWGTPQAATRRLRYNVSTEPVEAIDGRGGKTVVERDGFGRPRLIRDPDGNELDRDYDAAGRVIRTRLLGPHPLTSKHERWAEARRTYDAVGRLIEEVELLFVPGAGGTDDEVRTRYFFDEINRLTSLVDAEGREWRFEYDGLGRLVARQGPTGDRTEWKFDDPGRAVAIIDKNVGSDDLGTPLTQVFRRTVRHDARALAVEHIDGLGNAVSQSFDSRGLPGRRVDAGGHPQTMLYDVYGRPVRYSTPVGGVDAVTTMSYDANGNIVEARSPVGGLTTWTYDALDRMASEERGGAVAEFEYDQEDNLVLSRDRNGVVVKRVFSPAGRLIRLEPDASGYSPPPALPSYVPATNGVSEYRYTPYGNIAVATNDVASCVLGYDSLGRVIDETKAARTVLHRYDRTGRLIGFTYPEGREIALDYDPGGHLQIVRQTAEGSSYPGAPGGSAEKQILRVWRVGDRPLAIRFGDGHVARLGFDSGKRPIAIDWARVSDGVPIARERLLRDGRSRWSVHQVDSELHVLSHDDLGRLVGRADYGTGAPIDVAGLSPPGAVAELGTAATQADIDALIAAVTAGLAPPSLMRQFTYQLDENLNRVQSQESLSPPVPPVATTYAADALDRYQAIDGVIPAYDRAGNLVHDGSNAYRYDLFGQLAEIASAAGTIKIKHDPLARPYRMVSSAGDVKLGHLGEQVIEWLRDGAVEAQTVPLGTLHRSSHVAVGGGDYAPLFDLGDSVVGWIAAGGIKAGSSVYDPFGQVIERTPGWPAPFGFAGFWEIGESGVRLLPARGYLPRLGRFLQPDPLGPVDGPNPYAFAHHAPGSLSDELGLSSTDIDWGTVAVEGVKTVAVGGAVIAGTSALVAAGVVSAPFVLTVGALVLVGVAMMSFFRRSEEAFDAGKTDFQGRAAVAALGDTVGVSSIYEGATGQDAVTDRVFQSRERSERLGSGLGSTATFAFGGRFAALGGELGAAVPKPYLYRIPSISRPSYYNPIIYGEYVTPEGLVLRGDIRPGLRAGGGTLLRTRSLSEAYRATIDAAGSTRQGGRFFHVLRHFHDQPGRLNAAGLPQPHGVFAPWYRGQVVYLLDSAFEASTNPAAGNAFGRSAGQRWQVLAWFEDQPIVGAQFGHPAARGYGQALDHYTVVIDQPTLEPVTMFPGLSGHF